MSLFKMISRVFVLVTALLMSAASFAAGGYQNSKADIDAFSNFFENFEGKMVCIAVDRFYRNPVTTHIDADPVRKQFVLSAYDRTGAVIYSDGHRLSNISVNLSYISEQDSGREARFEDSKELVNFVVGLGSARGSDARFTSAEFPFTAGFVDYQLHNLCRIDRNRNTAEQVKDFR